MTGLRLVGEALLASAGMLWEILWALILGFALSGVVTVFVPRGRIARALGRPGPKELGRALALGALSSSCSYAAASMARSLFRKGAHIVPALAFMLASTNLVVELSAVLWVLLGWRFVAAELLGGVLMVFVMAGLMSWFGPLEAFERARERSEGGGSLPGGATPEGEGTVPRIGGLEGWRAVGRSFVAEWRMIWTDIALGLLISGFVMTFVPHSFWGALFLQERGPLQGGGLLRLAENAAVAPLVSVLSFVCSVGNIPLAGVLYREGAAFGGALSFIYADLIILPLILVYRRYYGWRLALWISGIFYVSMAVTGVLVELLFRALGLVPARPGPALAEGMARFSIDSTFWLNLVFVAVAAALVGLARGAAAPDAGGEEGCCHHE